MKNTVLGLFPVLIAGCSFRPDNTVNYTAPIPAHDITVVYDQRMPCLLGGEENVYAQLDDARRVTIDMNGRFSGFLHVSVSKDGRWYRFYLKDRHELMGHVEYRDVDGDGELDRFWISKNERPSHARPHPYSIVAYLDRVTGKAYRNNRDFGFSTSPDRDYFGCKSELESSQDLLGHRVDWEPMHRQ